MTDDIVTLLRGSWDCSCLYIKEHGLDRKCLDCEAADEIERLRAELENCERNFHALKVMFDKMRVGRNYWRKYAEQNYGK